jgi:hypothetical protein
MATTETVSALQQAVDGLTNPKVVKVGERKPTIYVIGLAKEGRWAGLKTTAVET